MPRSIRANQVRVHADKIHGRVVNRQTGNHEGQTRTAEKNVTVEVTKQKSAKGSSEEYPESGSVFKTKKAEISAKRIYGPRPSDEYGSGQKSITAEEDVTVVMKNRRRSS